MKIITAKYIYIDGEYKQNLGIAFTKKIGKIAPLGDLLEMFPDAEVTIFEDNSVIYAGFVNMHTHLEFSANRATLKLGDFIEWLYSVIRNRDDLIEKVDGNLIEFATDEMLKSGVTTFGAISSFGEDLQGCVRAKQRVIYFNEVIGSNPAMVDALFNDFKSRLEESLEYKSDRFYPAVAIHSPYSVHPFLIREVLKIAKERRLITTAHFLESPYEREWLEKGEGEFLTLFKNFFNVTKPITTIEEFLSHFDDHPTLFTHVTQAKEEEFKILNSQNHSVIHAPRSNRLLNCGVLDIKKPNTLLLGTDGLSSNYSLSIIDELKSALFIHSHIDPRDLAIELIDSITTNVSKAINIKIGRVAPSYFADFAILRLPNDFLGEDKKDIALHSIINSKNIATFVGGKRVF